MIADYLEEILIDAGYDVCGIAGNVAEAIALGERDVPTSRVIDLRLFKRGTSAPRLPRRCTRAADLGVLYATGKTQSTRSLQGCPG